VKIAVVLHQDRHCDPTVYLFADVGKAVAKARQLAGSYGKNWSEEHRPRGYVYYGVAEDTASITITVEEVQ